MGTLRALSLMVLGTLLYRDCRGDSLDADSPETVFGFVGSIVELPCLGAAPMIWERAAHENSDLQRRSFSTEGSDFVIKTIDPAKKSDAGIFVCENSFARSETELIIIDEMSEPLNVRVENAEEDKAKIRWNAPEKNKDFVVGYTLYVSEGVGLPPAIFSVDSVRANGDEDYFLQDLAPATSYEIKVTALYPEGAEDLGDTREGPPSDKIVLTTSNFAGPPLDVSAKPGVANTVIVSWKPPKNVDDSNIAGYEVYHMNAKKKSKKERVTSPEPNGQWQAILNNLPIKQRYKIQVAAILKSKPPTMGKKSAPITYRHDGFAPEFSLTALALTPDTIIVTVQPLWPAKVDKVRLFISDDTAVKWNRITGYKTKAMYAVVTGLQPRTKYFIQGKARVNKKGKQTVTHVLTPPSGLEAPTDLEVSAQSESSVTLAWTHQSKLSPTGFIVKVDRELENGQFGPEQQSVVFDKTMTLIEELSANQNYQAKVVPFDLDGKGMESEPVFFHLAASAEETTTTEAPMEAPVFVQEPPKDLHISQGDDVKLSCSAIGKPNPDVSWLKDGRPIGKVGDRTNELVLKGLQEDARITCVANNSVSSITTPTYVHVSLAYGEEPPMFENKMPETLVVKRGDKVTLDCKVTGAPPITIKWFKGDKKVRRHDNEMTFVEKNFRRAGTIMCVAMNQFGKVNMSTVVSLEELRVPPTPLEDEAPPESLEIDMGQPLNLSCGFTGSPAPLVVWLFEGSPISPLELSRSTFNAPAWHDSGLFVCRGENLAGRAEQTVNVTVVPIDDDYKVILDWAPMPGAGVKIFWSVEEGNLDDLSSFQLMLKDKRGYHLVRTALSPDSRVYDIRGLYPDEKFEVTLKTLSTTELEDEQTLDVMMRRVMEMPEFDASVREIRDDNVRINFATLDPRKTSSYRVRVHNFDVSEPLREIFNEKYHSQVGSLKLERLQPDSNHRVMITASDLQNNVYKEAVLDFRTAPRGKYGTPVESSWTPLGATTSATTTTTTTMGYGPMKTTTTTMEYGPKETSTTTTTTTKPPDDRTHHLTLRATKVTPYQLHIWWNVEQGDLSAIDSFTVSMSESGTVRVQEALTASQRSLTIQPLQPSTRYDIFVQAKGNNRVLAEASTPVVTASEDAVPGAYPVLNLEANEIRSNSTRLNWMVVDAQSNQVRSYRITVRDQGPNGQVMLRQTLNNETYSIELKPIPVNKRYHIRLDALGPSGRAILSASLTFETPDVGRDGIPVRTSSRGARPSAPITRAPPTTPPLAIHEPILEIELTYNGPSSAKLTWTLAGPVPYLYEYKLTVRDRDPRKSLMFGERIGLNVMFYTLKGFLRQGSYYISLEAVTRNDATLLKAATVFDMDRLYRGPIRASSLTPDPSDDLPQPLTPIRRTRRPPPPLTTVAPPPPTRPVARDLVITQARPLDSTTLYVEWHPTRPGGTPKRTLLRFARFYANQRRRDSYVIRYFQPGQNRARLSSLQPGETYGVQVAEQAPTRGYLKWSKLVLTEMK